jgi:SRSO17 transposase
VEPLAAAVAPAEVSRQHQSMLHFVGQSAWSDAAVLAAVREHVQPVLESHGPIEAWIIDDTGFPKQGTHSVGVARQYCGQLGKQDNCQNAVSLSMANHHASLPVGYRLYLPQEWAEDRARRKKVGVPDEVTFQTKPAIALDLIKQAMAEGVPSGVVLADAGYGTDTAFRDAVTALGLRYAMGIGPATGVWAPGTQPLPPLPRKPGQRGVLSKRLRREGDHKPVSVKDLAMGLPASAWKTVAWREGSNAVLKGRFARLRVRPSHRDNLLTRPRSEEWLIIEWPEGQKEPEKYWFSTLPEDVSFEKLMDTIKLRWRIERDYQELKQEVGLDHYEGRSWRGFHHHATLCIAAYGFLISERETIPPSGHSRARSFETLAIPNYRRPQQPAPASRKARSQLHNLPTKTPRRRPR